MQYLYKKGQLCYVAGGGKRGRETKEKKPKKIKAWRGEKKEEVLGDPRK